MQFASLLLAMAASLVAASPVPEAAEGAALESRAITHLYMCYNENFTGACQNLPVNTGSCSMDPPPGALSYPTATGKKNRNFPRDDGRLTSSW